MKSKPVNPLQVIGQLQKHKNTVLFIPGGLTSPEVYQDIEVPDNFQAGRVNWSMSPGPWDIETTAKRLAQFIRDRDLGPTLLVGYSAGGAISLCTALEAGDRVAGLLLSNTGANTLNHGDPNFPDKILANWGTPELLEPFFARCFAKAIPAKLKKQLIDYANKMDKQAGYEGAYSLRQLDLVPRLKEIHCEVTIAHGIDDTSRTPEHAQQLKDGIPQAKLVYLEGGHTIMVENKPLWQQELHLLMAKIAKDA